MSEWSEIEDEHYQLERIHQEKCTFTLKKDDPLHRTVHRCQSLQGYSELYKCWLTKGIQ
jgi:hypothetical protein